MQTKSISAQITAEPYLLNTLLTILAGKDKEKKNYLYAALGYIISQYLHFDPYWPYRDRWIDDTIFFSQMVTAPNKVHIFGYINWGYLINASNGIYEPLEAEFVLCGEGQDQYIDYSIKFCCDGIARHITPTGIKFDHYHSDKIAKPNAEIFRTILYGDSSAIVNRTINAKLHNCVGPEVYGALTQLKEGKAVNFRDRWIAALLLNKLGPEGDQVLVDALNNDELALQLSALQSLSLQEYNDIPLLPHIKKLLDHKEQIARSVAATLFYYFSEEDIDHKTLQSAIPDLLWLLNSYHDQSIIHPKLQFIAVQAVIYLAQRDDHLINILIDKLNDERQREYAADILITLGIKAEKALSIATEQFYVDDRFAYIAGEILYSIGSIKSRQVLIDGLSDERKHVRNRAFDLLINRKKEHITIPMLKDWIFSKETPPFNRFSMLWILTEFEPRTPEIEKLLTAAIKPLTRFITESADSNTRRFSIEILGKIGPLAISLLPLLINILSEVQNQQLNNSDKDSLTTK